MLFELVHRLHHLAMPPASTSEWKVHSIACLTSIATIIGTGILALPVTMFATSIPAFLFIFTVALIAQIAVVYAAVELMQRVQKDDPSLHPQPSPVPEIATSGLLSSNRGEKRANESDNSKHPSLFALSRTYLPNVPLRTLFNVCTVAFFFSTIIRYGLAGPQALHQLLHPKLYTSTPTVALRGSFAFTGIFAVLLFADALLPIFGALTVAKAALFFCVVVVVAFLPQSVVHTPFFSLIFGRDVSSSQGISTAAVPFLMSTVALGGAVNTMPITYKLLPRNPSSDTMRRFRFAQVLALTFCYLLNVGWVLVVLRIVPRETLQEAFRRGQISTIPLAAALDVASATPSSSLSPTLRSIITGIVQAFTLLSTAVCFFVNSAGCKSYLDGAAMYVTSNLESQPRAARKIGATRLMLYVLAFGGIVLVIIADADAFIKVLTRVYGSAVSMQSGVLLLYMFVRSRGSCFARGDIGGQRVGDLGGPADGNEITSGRTEAHVIPLKMKRSTAITVLVFGTLTFAVACFLATVGPLLGIELDAPSE